MLPIHRVPDLRRRLPRLIVGLALCGIGITLMIRADLGLGAWDVLHQGLARFTGRSIGTVGIFVGLLLLLVWIPLRERVGLGTVMNVVMIGPIIDFLLPLVATPGPAVLRWGMFVLGLLLLATGSGLYVGAGYGAGPRDGLMTALARRGVPVVTARSGIESAALFGGWLLGGRIGLGTLVFTLGIGPLVHVVLPHLALDDRYRSPGHGPGVWPSVRGQRSTETPRVFAAPDGPRHPARPRPAQ